MNIWVFSRSEGAGRATTRKTRGLTRSVIARIVPPLPAASRPSKTTITRKPLYLTHSCSLQSSACSRRSSFVYSLLLNLSCFFSVFSSAIGYHLFLGESPLLIEFPLLARQRPWDVTNTLKGYWVN